VSVEINSNVRPPVPMYSTLLHSKVFDPLTIQVNVIFSLVKASKSPVIVEWSVLFSSGACDEACAVIRRITVSEIQNATNIKSMLIIAIDTPQHIIVPTWVDRGDGWPPFIDSFMHVDYVVWRHPPLLISHPPCTIIVYYG
jgi:hypothetical protein